MPALQSSEQMAIVSAATTSSVVKKMRGKRQKNKLHAAIYKVVEVSVDGAPKKPKDVLAKWRNDCGCLARERCKIVWNNWKEVPVETKNELWEHIKAHYIFPEDRLEDAKIATLKTIGKALRTFRTKLNTQYLQKEESPLNDYGFITSNEWEEFKLQHSSEIAKQKSLKFKELNKRNKFPHTLGPGGYKVKEEEWSKKEEEDRAAGRPEMFSFADQRTKRWLLGRAKKDPLGQYVISDSQTSDICNRVKELAELEKAGKFKPQGCNDQLTAALGNEEHRGRTRGVSSIAPWKNTFKKQATDKNRQALTNAPEGREEWERHFYEFIRENPHIIPNSAAAVVVPEARIDVPSSVGSVQEKYAVQCIKEDTPCSLHVPVGRKGLSQEAARGIAMPGRIFHNKPIPPDYSKVQVTEITNDRFSNDPLDHPMVDEGIETIRDAVNNFVLWASADIHLLNRQSPTGSRNNSPLISSQSPRLYDDNLSPVHEETTEKEPVPNSAPEKVPVPEPVAQKEPVPQITEQVTELLPEAAEEPQMPRQFSKPVPEEKDVELEKQGTHSDTVLVSDPAVAVSEPDLQADTRQKETPTRIHKTIVPVGQQHLHESEMLKFFASYSQTRSMSLKSTEEAPVQKQGPLSEEQWTYGDDDHIEYVKGKPLLPLRTLQRLPWELNGFHDWYLKAHELGVTQIQVQIPESVFNCPSFTLFLYFEDFHSIFRLKRLDITTLMLWCL